MCWSPETLGAQAQLGLGGTHLTVRAPRRLHKDPAIQTRFTTHFINTRRQLVHLDSYVTRHA